MGKWVLGGAGLVRRAGHDPPPTPTGHQGTPGLTLQPSSPAKLGGHLSVLCATPPAPPSSALTAQQLGHSQGEAGNGR